MRIKSEYSFRHAYGKIEDVHNRVLQLDWSAAPISDRLSTFGFTDWDKLCEEVKVKPVFGVELGVTPILGQKKPPVSYWTFFATSKLRTINELVLKATSKPGYYPLLSYEEAVDVKDAIIITDNKVLMQELAHFNLLDKLNNVYIALSPSTPIGLFRDAKKWGYKFIASSDNVFTYPDDKLPYHTLIGKNSETSLFPQYIMTDEEWRAALPYCVTDIDAQCAIINRDFALDVCNAKLLKADIFRPSHNYSLRQMCEDGAAKLGIDLNDSIYAERLDREIQLIEEKNFQDYF